MRPESGDLQKKETASFQRNKSQAVLLTFSTILIFLFFAGLYTGAVTPLPDDFVESGLLAHWSFDEGSGATAVDFSGNGNDAALLNGAGWIADGVLGGALSFDGVDDRIEGGGANIVFGQESISAFAWVASNDVNGSQSRIMGKDFNNPGPGGYLWLNFGNGVPWLEVRDSTDILWIVDSSGVDIADDQWHHVGFVIDRDSDRVGIYVDGILRGSRAVVLGGVFGDSTTTQNFRIGSHIPTAMLSLNGAVDEARVYNRALSDAEIQLLYQEPFQADTSAPLRSKGLPQEILPLDTAFITLSLVTNERAVCKYSAVQNTSYASMTDVFSLTGGGLHSTVTPRSANKATYVYYVRCQDAAGNVNADDYPIVFSVGESTVYVDTKNPAASDTNPGTPQLPFKTISKAVTAADENNRNNIATKIMVYPGVYREAVIVNPVSGQTDAPIAFEAAEKGKAIISGSDIWTGWKKKPNTNIYTRSWPYDWGLSPYPDGWQGNVTLQNIVRRREMIFINGKLLTQVLSYNALKGNSFYVSEADNTVYIRPTQGINISAATVEVATRAGIFSVINRSNITLRGFTFRHDNTPVEAGGVSFAGSSDILVEDCQFLWNNWRGLSFSASQNVTVRRSVAN